MMNSLVSLGDGKRVRWSSYTCNVASDHVLLPSLACGEESSMEGGFNKGSCEIGDFRDKLIIQLRSSLIPPTLAFS